MAAILLQPIGYVRSTRKAIEDDQWDSVQSTIELIPELTSDSLLGLDAFSHVQVLFYFHQVSDDKIVLDARHPRNNSALPRVGIFAQRGKNRPNKLGLTTCQLVDLTGTTLTVRGLDAIDDTPVLDYERV